MGCFHIESPATRPTNEAGLRRENSCVRWGVKRVSKGRQEKAWRQPGCGGRSARSLMNSSGSIAKNNSHDYAVRSQDQRKPHENLRKQSGIVAGQSFPATLDADAQAELVAVLRRRLAERGRERVAATVAQARREFAAGQCQPMTAAELVRETQS